jgi:hypothetical protein
VEFAMRSSMAVKQSLFSRESAQPVRSRLSPVPGLRQWPSLCVVRSCRIFDLPRTQHH